MRQRERISSQQRIRYHAITALVSTSIFTLGACAPSAGTVFESDPGASDALAARNIGYVGCSMSNNAVEGYRSRGGRRFWDVQPSYGGGGITQWGEDLSSSSRYWKAFEAAQAARPADVIWWELCTVDTDRDADEYSKAEAVFDELRRRAPQAAIYVSAQPAYLEGHVCTIAGAGGPERMKTIADKLVAEGKGLAGPIMGPLATAYIADGCHANAAGQMIMGEQLRRFFDGRRPPASPPTPADPSTPSTPSTPPTDGGSAPLPSGAPRGIYSLNEFVDKPFVSGYVLRIGWKNLEPQEGVYDFSAIENAVRKAQSLNQKITLTTMAMATPSWLLSKVKTYNGSLGQTAVPWDPVMLAALEKLISAQSTFQIDGVALKDHPTVANVDTAIGGSQGVRLQTLPSGYDAETYKAAVIRAVRAWAAAYPSKHLFLSLFAVSDNKTNPTTAESIRDALLAEFDGVAKPRLNFFIEYLTGDKPDTTSPLGKVIYDVHTQTSIMMQACGEWSRQADWSWCNWKSPSDTPEDGFKLGFNTFGTTYYEIYPADLKNAAYTTTFESWASKLK